MSAHALQNISRIEDSRLPFGLPGTIEDKRVCNSNYLSDQEEGRRACLLPYLAAKRERHVCFGMNYGLLSARRYGINRPEQCSMT